MVSGCTDGHAYEIVNRHRHVLREETQGKGSRCWNDAAIARKCP